MTVKELKRILENVPDEAEILMHLESKGGRAFEIDAGKYFIGSELNSIDEDDYDAYDEAIERLGLPYDGNCLLESRVRAEAGIVILSDCGL